jgi:cytochrome c peroxidase
MHRRTKPLALAPAPLGALLGVATLIVALGACAPAETPFAPEIHPIPDAPLGIDASQMVVSSNNPLSPEKVALGWQLFYDPRLSADESISCASCHIAEFGFGDPDAVSLGVNNARGRRNSNPVINSAFNASQNWDGKAATLEDQALLPLVDPVEMANTTLGVEIRLNRIPGYRAQFATVFGTEEIEIENVTQALAAFERVLLAGNSPWDQWTTTRDESVISEAARRGHDVFIGKGGCSQCHVGALFTDAPSDQYHNIGVKLDRSNPDWGRFEVTGEEADRGAFKTPTLRNVAQTAPYMHDGSIATIEEVIDLYNVGGVPNDWLDPKIGMPLGLTDDEKADLLAFLQSLTGEVPEWTTRAPELPPDVADDEM